MRPGRAVGVAGAAGMARVCNSFALQRRHGGRWRMTTEQAACVKQ